MKFFASLEKQKNTWFLLIASVLFFLFRLPSLFEPNWYGDEGIYEVIGYGLRHGRLLYTGIWDNKPPLLYYIYGIFSGDQFATKLLSLFVGLATFFVFFILVKKIFPSQQKVAWITSSVFGFLFATPLIEGNIANAENFMLLPIILAGLLIYISSLRGGTTKQSQAKGITTLTAFARNDGIIVGSGFLLGLAFLIKIVAVFDFAAFFLFLGIVSFTNIKNLPTLIRELLIFTIGFLFPLLCITLIFATKGTLSAFFTSAFKSNVGYVGYGNALVLGKIIIPQGLLLLKLLVLACLCFFIFLKRKALSPSQIFIYLWIGFSTFNFLFSQRNYPHYLLVGLASLCLGCATLFARKQTKILSGFLLTVSFLLIYTTFGIPFKTNNITGYYGNYIGMLTGTRSLTNYYDYFDPHVGRDYTLAQFLTIRLTPNQSIFIWGNNGQLYKLTNTLPPGRFIVAYHMTLSKKFSQETYMALQKSRPQFLVIMPNVGPFPFALSGYEQRFIIQNTRIYEKIL